MKSPTVPTDSLYKLMAVGGLLLAVACFSAPRFFYYRVNSEAAMLRNEWSEFNVAYQELNKVADRPLMFGFDEKRDYIIAKLDMQNPNSADRRKWFETADEIDVWLAEGRVTQPSPIPEKAAKAQQLLWKARLRASRIMDLVDQRRDAEAARTYGTFPAIVMSVVGFILWFVRIQRHEDAALVNRATEQKNGAATNGHPVPQTNGQRIDQPSPVTAPKRPKTKREKKEARWAARNKGK